MLKTKNFYLLWMMFLIGALAGLMVIGNVQNFAKSPTDGFTANGFGAQEAIDFAVIGAAICFSESTVIIKSFPQAHPITTNAIGFAIGSGLLFALSALWNETPTLPTLPATWLSLLYLIIFGSIATFVLTLYVVKHWTASASSYQFVLMPFITIPVSAFLLKENISLTFIIGGIFVLAGTYIGGIAQTEQLARIFRGLVYRHKTPTPECCD